MNFPGLSKKLGLLKGSPVPPGVLSVIVYGVLWRLLTMYLGVVSCSPPGMLATLRFLYGMLAVTNAVFIVYLGLDAAAYPWPRRGARKAAVSGYALAFLFLLASQFIIWMHQDPRVFWAIFG